MERSSGTRDGTILQVSVSCSRALHHNKILPRYTARYAIAHFGSDVSLKRKKIATGRVVATDAPIAFIY